MSSEEPEHEMSRELATYLAVLSLNMGAREDAKTTVDKAEYQINELERRNLSCWPKRPRREDNKFHLNGTNTK